MRCQFGHGGSGYATYSKKRVRINNIGFRAVPKSNFFVLAPFYHGYGLDTILIRFRYDFDTISIRFRYVSSLPQVLIWFSVAELRAVLSRVAVLKS